MLSYTLRFFNNLFKSESLSGLILIGCVIISLIIANTAAGVHFEQLLAKELGMNFSNLELRHPIIFWINDGLMAVFFLLVGLEIKREAIEGELSTLKKAIFPIVAALGGVLVPALIYALINQGTETAKGWGIPMATDIAFALAIVTMLGNQIPASLKIFLSALAIVDDLCAIVVIAIFYSTSLNGIYLGYAAGIFFLLLVFNRLGIKHLTFYLLPALVMWYFVHHSGVHATIAGVLTALTIPTKPSLAHSLLVKLEHILVRPVNFLIMPLFALVNTNIRFESSMIEGLTNTLGIGVILGLLIGKPLGIFLFSFTSVKAGFCTLPSGAYWQHIVGLGVLGGIGFTISIFVANLSFTSPIFISQAKFAILIGSVLAGLLGYIVLRQFDRQ